MAGLLDFVMSALVLVAMMIYYHVQPGWALLWSPLVIVLMVLLTTGASMFVAALNVRYRDVKYVLPFLIEIWLFVTPIIYPISIIPARSVPSWRSIPAGAWWTGYGPACFRNTRWISP